MIRPSEEEVIKWFASRMANKLNRAQEDHNYDECSWLDSSNSSLLTSLAEELIELLDAVNTSAALNDIIDEACDVALYAMMLAHRADLDQDGYYADM